jgi:hypothetical protein
VLNHRRQRYGKRLSQLADRRWTPAEALNECSPCGIGERVERAVEGCLILKHILKYTLPRACVKGAKRARGRAGVRAWGCTCTLIQRDAAAL